MHLAVPDLISNSYFPAIAAAELGYFHAEGLDVDLELRFPVTDAAAALQDGQIDLLAGAAHAPLVADPAFSDLRLLAALSRNTYWFLVVHPDLPIDRTTLASMSDVTIGAAPGVDLALRQVFADLGVDTETSSIRIAPVPGAAGGGVSFGVTAADALDQGLIDGFWANGMGTEVAVRRGAKVVLDARRDTPPVTGYTFPALMAHRRTVEETPEVARAAVRAIMRAHRELRADLSLATKVGEALFPELEASLIATLIGRDLPFYDHRISNDAVASLQSFAAARGLSQEQLDPHTVVPQGAREAWEA